MRDGLDADFGIPTVDRVDRHLRRRDPYISESEPSAAVLKRHGRILVNPQLEPYLGLIENYAALQGGSIVWTSGYRSPREQAELRRRWASGDPSVPFEPAPDEQSKHVQGGRAADGEITPAALASRLGTYAQALGLGWLSREPWHFELKG